MDIADCDPDDAGKYSLEIANDSGSAAVDIPVKVKGKFHHS